MQWETPALTAPGYLALPPAGRGPGVLVLHAWWGLNDFFVGLCDRLAQAGFVAAAPDLYGHGRTASTVAEAEQLLAQRDMAAMERNALGALEALAQHPDVEGPGLGVIGFSLGAAYALALAGSRPERVRAVVIFYGAGEVDFSATQAAFQGHFAPNDEWESDEYIQQMEQGLRAAGREVEFHYYPGARHWFFENNRPADFQEEAARLAWGRTISFLKARLER